MSIDDEKAPEEQASTAKPEGEGDKDTNVDHEQPQEQQDENAPAKSIALNDKWTMWFDNPRLAPAGSE